MMTVRPYHMIVRPNLRSGCDGGPCLYSRPPARCGRTRFRPAGGKAAKVLYSGPYYSSLPGIGLNLTPCRAMPTGTVAEASTMLAVHTMEIDVAAIAIEPWSMNPELKPRSSTYRAVSCVVTVLVFR